MKQPVKYCAVYTRKSTEEGLDQDFNTLDAQREACLAYITNQKAEGWTALATHYDDGGYTGGNIDRPALQKLLADISAGRVNTVVVYKIDRLTRSLMDFSKLVELFDKHQVTFVSVTQSFNTTTSMGRLTLNVLLSFAQFEREVIGERVRDKIAASKKKGMWMGGSIPAGYGIVNKTLVPKKEEIPFVLMIFNRYLELGCVRKLMLELRRTKVVSRQWVSSTGKHYGGNNYSRGALYWMLSNPVYIGKTRHKDQIYDGLHEGIMPQELWNKVQEKLKSNSVQIKVKSGVHKRSILTGLLHDHEGTRYSPSHTNKKGRRYRYYISQNLMRYRDHPKGLMARLPADEIEDLVRQTIAEQFLDHTKTAAALNVDPVENHKIVSYVVTHNQKIDIDAVIASSCAKIILNQESLRITLNSYNLTQFIKERFNLSPPEIHKDIACEIITPYHVTRSSKGAIRIDGENERLSKDDPFNRAEHEVQNWVRGTVWRDLYFRGKSLDDIAAQECVDVRYIARLIDESLSII